MRVRVLKPTVAYWNYAVQTFEPGREESGDLARHLAANAPEGSVEVLEADPEPEQPAAPLQEPPEGGAAEESAGGDAPPVDGTIDALMGWVGQDPARAAVALAAEQAKDKPRSTAIKLLTALVEE